MRIRAILLLILPIFLATSISFSDVPAVEERKVLGRSYVGLGVEVYAPYQCYPGETITVRVKVEALEDVENASVTVFIWSSKSEGHNPWGTSFTVLDVTDFANGTIEEAYSVTLPLDTDPGLAYGILYLGWSVFRSPSWEDQWDKASFRVTYVKNRDYEDLQTSYNSVLGDLQTTEILMYMFLVTTVALAISTAYFAIKKSKAKKTRK